MREQFYHYPCWMEQQGLKETLGFERSPSLGFATASHALLSFSNYRSLGPCSLERPIGALERAVRGALFCDPTGCAPPYTPTRHTLLHNTTYKWMVF